MIASAPIPWTITCSPYIRTYGVRRARVGGTECGDKRHNLISITYVSFRFVSLFYSLRLRLLHYSPSFGSKNAIERETVAFAIEPAHASQPSCIRRRHPEWWYPFSEFWWQTNRPYLCVQRASPGLLSKAANNNNNNNNSKNSKNNNKINRKCVVYTGWESVNCGRKCRIQIEIEFEFEFAINILDWMQFECGVPCRTSLCQAPSKSWNPLIESYPFSTYYAANRDPPM